MRSPTSHKGDNGSVAIIGGSTFQHGAPLFAALAAEASGVDLLYVFVPLVHEEVARNASFNFQVHPFGTEASDELSSKDRALIIEMLATMDSVVIGPGLSRTSSNLTSVHALLEECPCPVVADATALQKTTLKALHGKKAVVTPHLGELERMEITLRDAEDQAKKHGVTLLIKGHEDTVISAEGTTKRISGGNAGLTVGGTGDALAGLTAGLMAQGHSPDEACVLASTVIKNAGDVLFEEMGFSYTTHDIILSIPHLLRNALAS